MLVKKRHGLVQCMQCGAAAAKEPNKGTRIDLVRHARRAAGGAASSAAPESGSQRSERVAASHEEEEEEGWAQWKPFPEQARPLADGRQLARAICATPLMIAGGGSAFLQLLREQCASQGLIFLCWS